MNLEFDEDCGELMVDVEDQEFPIAFYCVVELGHHGEHYDGTYNLNSSDTWSDRPRKRRK